MFVFLFNTDLLQAYVVNKFENVSQLKKKKYLAFFYQTRFYAYIISELEKLDKNPTYSRYWQFNFVCETFSII